MIEKDDEEKVYLRLGTLLRFYRKKKGLSQDDIARHIGLSRISIVNIEQGNQKIQLHDLLDLLLLLNIDPTELFNPLFVILKNRSNQKREKNITKGLEHIDNKEDVSKILNEFWTFSNLKK
ncbi:helix-turn-helix domain-containing protein [Mucilaginibacter boryungensis]|uniref:Helix-turn-helix domain-containing protein n=1 Tax=Mucilaginibacter boryungensis TaxID=768480 RepID=A0ABR9XMP3_9SPHI|nr:helix-turn-helix transcriptional regulator [Mucilaginibacter boryungensis]MBE9668218.1 helix-turn-helix domain-containing protein [Mucilaginibacter boryungensis]